MDSFELNKVAGAVLGTLLFALGTGFLAELIYHPKPAGEAGYALPEPAPAAEGGGAAAAAKVEPIAVRLAGASEDKGRAGAKACTACHSLEKDGPNKIGPALWGVVERPKAQHAGFDYSAALKEKGGAWTYADLDHFLESPKGYAKGTKMAFQGIGDAKQRADVVLYLHSLSDSPKPLPAAEPAATKADDQAPAAKPDAKSEAKPEPKAETKPAGAAGQAQDAQSAQGDAAKKAQPAAPGPGESADTDRPGGSGKATSQTQTGTNPPEAKPAGDPAPANSGVGPVTQPAAKPDPAAEKKAQEVRDGGAAKPE